MAWVQSESASFRARHESGEAEDARAVLLALERARAELAPRFASRPEGLTVVLHPTPTALAMSNPLLPLVWLLAAPSARRYITGWAGRQDLHVLSPAALRERAANLPGSREMLGRSAACLYARRVIDEVNPDLHRVAGPIRIRRSARWAWLIEGAARWFGGQTDHARAAIARRLYEGGRPRFPPGLRDAALLGGTVIDLLVARAGPDAAVRLVSRLHPRGPDAALAWAFGDRSLSRIEAEWRAHLAALASGR
ncbi:MAG: hypothetical protein JOZ07_07980 [Solirubrobacterales bacterium]|nr:hypothetical protein [Solirubrobacterales bacterium]